MKSKSEIKSIIEELEQKHHILEMNGQTADANGIEHDIEELQEIHDNMQDFQLADISHIY